MIRYYDNVAVIYELVLLPVIQNTQEKYKRKKMNIYEINCHPQVNVNN